MKTGLDAVKIDNFLIADEGVIPTVPARIDMA